MKNAEKIMISLPSDLSARLRATVPTRQHSKLIAELLEVEIQKREQALYECAVAVENDKKLNNDMKDWETLLLPWD